MNIAQQIKEAFESLIGNKLRSGLTILGIVIGVAAVISMLAIGRGAQSSISSSIESIGTNLLFINSTNQNGATSPQPLTIQDAEALADKTKAPLVSKVAAVLQGRVEMTASGKYYSGSVTATTPEYAEIRSMGVSEGQMFTQTQMDNRSAVVVIGTEVATNLFGVTSGVVGKSIRMEGQPFKIIGVLESKGGGAMGSQDNQVLIPLTTGQSRLFHRSNRSRVDSITVQVSSSDQMTTAVTQVTDLLRARHKNETGKEDFSVMNQSDMLATASSITGVLTMFLGGVGAISLLVGGIGIMNIMLVSVTERTREIGLRKALGARRKDILAQFLTESLMLSLMGGIIGILLAALISAIIGKIASSQSVAISPVIGIDAVLLATLFSLGIGLFFGLYPANRVAGLEPVEALRNE